MGNGVGGEGVDDRDNGRWGRVNSGSEVAGIWRKRLRTFNDSPGMNNARCWREGNSDGIDDTRRDGGSCRLNEDKH